MNFPILKTKLHCPLPPPKFVRRPLLLQRLNEGLESGRGITLVSAPAGFGKTTCISEWIHSLDLPVAWLSLDPSDNDPVSFFVYLLAALQTIDADLGKEIEAVIRAGQVPPVEVISAILVNDILKIESQFLLVLDDFHAIQESTILEVMESLIANHPQSLHLVLLTREDPSLPMARLRANNKLTELRAKNLRFSTDHIEIFLKEVMGLSIPKKDIAILEEKTEGWIAGLQLAGLSIRDKSDPSRFISKLSGSHQFILSYLTEQVLGQQPQEIREFLLQTAILDKFNSELCNAVTNRSDSGDLLVRLHTANLFLIPLDDEHHWFRYHHLFSDLLRGLQKTTPSIQINELHDRAAQWHAAEGMTNESIHHAFAAEDYGMVVKLLEDHALTMIMQGHVKTVNEWVQAVPEEWRIQSPKTHLAFAWMHLLRGSYSEAFPYLHSLEEAFSGPDVVEEEKNALKAEWLMLRSLLLTMEGRIEESLALAEEASEIVPKGDSRVRSMVYFGLACIFQVEGKYDLVVEAYQKAIKYGQSSGNYVTEMLSISGLAQQAFEHGYLQTAFEIAKPICEQLEKDPFLLPISTVVFGILGEVFYQWYQTSKARHYYQQAYKLSVLGGFSSGIINCQVLLSRTSLLEGDLEASAKEIDNVVGLMRLEIPAYVRQEVVSQQVRVYLAQNRLEEARLALQREGFSLKEKISFPDFPKDQPNSYSSGLLYNSSLLYFLYQGRVSQDQSSLKSGIELAVALVDNASKKLPVQINIETLLLRAQMYAELGDVSASQADYLRALKLGEPAGFVGVFVEQGSPVADAMANLIKQDLVSANFLQYVEQILSAFETALKADLEKMPSSEVSMNIKQKALIDPLTDRELELLVLMVEGRTYKEIAAQLFISINTVRYHVKAIYGKLNVNNRAQAIQKARQLNIL